MTQDAKIPATVGALVDRGIPVWIKNSERPASAGTRIGPRLATVYPDRAIVTVVGDGLRDTPGIGKSILKALSSVNVEMISQGASRVSVAIVVQNPCAEEVVCRLHDEFFPR